MGQPLIQTQAFSGFVNYHDLEMTLNQYLNATISTNIAGESQYPIWLKVHPTSQYVNDYLLHEAYEPSQGKFPLMNAYEFALSRAIRAHRARYPSDAILSADINARPYSFSYLPVYGDPSRPLEYCGTIDDYAVYFKGGSHAIERTVMLGLWDWRELYVNEASQFFGLRGAGGEAKYNYFKQYAPAWQGIGTETPVPGFWLQPGTRDPGDIPHNPAWIINLACMHFRGDIDVAKAFMQDDKYRDHFPKWIDAFFKGMIFGAVGGAATLGLGTVVAGSGTLTTIATDVATVQSAIKDPLKAAGDLAGKAADAVGLAVPDLGIPSPSIKLPIEISKPVAEAAGAAAIGVVAGFVGPPAPSAGKAPQPAVFVGPPRPTTAAEVTPPQNYWWVAAAAVMASFFI